ncbi:putative protein N(5)-glutamine methyltransferase [Nocardioides panacisoli]|uniref:putative protein N(5)-glutamine methyltransferase n=1 Tax=Nocardioides panacisoli TaxID=627624 RepID=UPI001C625C96|nr:putative protein N(5)-glutamine methyltransferase [Nocardioides panacisoli]QYJ03478.1 putative protein N(5)-glutamine methyltransferase [Nocardioides panacisoli]
MNPDPLVDRLRAAGCVFAEEEAALLVDAADGTALEELVRRRVAGEPLEHVLGWVAFAGLRVAVAPGVFVPRRRTTHLVDVAAGVTPPGGTVVDLCCGTGAIGLAVATRVPGVVLHAVDVDPAAVACARDNLAGLGTAYAGDLVAPLPADLRGRVDVMTANVPYVPDDAVAQMPADSRDHEPRTTVAGGPDGLDVLRRVATLAADWLTPGGRLLSEVSAGQGPAALAVLRDAGLSAALDHGEEYDATVVVGIAAAPRALC